MKSSEQWFSEFNVGLSRMVRRGRPGFVSVVWATAEPYAPLSLLKAGESLNFAQRQFWADINQQVVLVGLGQAQRLLGTTTDAPRIEAEWRSWMADCIQLGALDAPSTTGPVAMGGFRFDSAAVEPMKAPWQRWSDGQLTVPRWLLTTTAEGRWMTLNYWCDPSVGAQRDPDRVAGALWDEWCRIVTRLRAPADDRLESTLARIEEDDRDGWVRAVDIVASDIRRGELDKVVLARKIGLEGSTPWPIANMVDDFLATQGASYCFLFTEGAESFVGASPETLARLSGYGLETVCLAGSAPRGGNVQADEALAEELIHDAKNQAEHQIVVDHVLGIMDQLADAVTVVPAELARWPQVQHLLTRIAGRPKPAISILSAVAALHPTPALLGWPRDQAWAKIQAHEQFERGWYGGPVGWLDRNSQGQFAVAIRSALIDRERAWLFAGCGIVGASAGLQELAETRWKFGVLLHAMGVEAEVSANV